mgnify:CR=1 FL=1
MNTKVRKRLKGAIEKRLRDTGETWATIQKIKLKKVWQGFPCEFGTLWRVCKTSELVHRNTTRALLEFFNIKFTEENGVIKLQRRKRIPKKENINV